jgi:hypothetical protein
MDGIERIRSGVVHYKRGHAERRARKDVDAALATYCSAGGCPTSTAPK